MTDKQTIDVSDERKALLEIVEAHEAPYPSESAGMDAQDAWATRRDTSIKQARALLALKPQQAVPSKPFAYMSDAIAADVLGGSSLLSASVRGAPGGTFNFPLYTAQQATPISNRDLILLEQAHDMLLAHADDQRTNGNDAEARGAKCSADAVLRLGAAASRGVEQQAAQGEPMHVGACITDGRLHVTVMQRDSAACVHVLAQAEFDVGALYKHDCIAEAAPPVPAVTAQAQVPDDKDVITVQEAWDAAGGNPGIKATKDELLNALRLLDEVCDEAKPEQAQVPEGWHIGLTGGDEMVVQAPESSDIGGMTIPSGGNGARSVRLLDALCRDLLSASPKPPEPPEQAPQAVEQAVLDERERLCAAIKAEDDYTVTAGEYMMDSDDCIAVIRGTWVRSTYEPDPPAIRARSKKGGAL